MKDLTKEEIGDIVHWLRFEFPAEYQRLEETAIICKEYVKIIKGELMNIAEGGVTDRENTAIESDEYKKAVRRYAESQAKLTGLKAKQSGEIKAIDVWQSLGANTRAGI